MPLRHIGSSTEIRQAFLLALTLTEDWLRQAPENTPPPPDTTKLREQPIYTLGIRVLAQGGTSAGQVGWHCLCPTSKGTSIGCDVPYVNSAPDLRASQSQGSAIDSAAAALDWISEHPEIERTGEAYECRLLRIPGLLIEAFWLKAPPYNNGLASHDFVVPFHTYEKGLMAKRLWPMAEFLNIVRPLARSRLGKRTPV
jgi:hypothetical protein